MKLFSSVNFGFLFALLSISLSSCQKEGDAPPPVWSAVNSGSSNSSVSMTCKVNGGQWNAAEGMANASIYDNTSNLTGMHSNSSTITITISEAIVLNGAYDLGFNSGNGAVYMPSSTATNSWLSHIDPSAGGGTLIVTALDPVNMLISGNFEFDAVLPTDLNNHKIITEGEFTNLSFSNSASGPDENSFTVDIDGDAFVPAAINGIIMDSKIRIVASDAQGVQSVSLSVPEDIEAGTYELGSAFSDYSGMYNHDASTFTSSNSGTLTISTHDPSSGLIEGSFYFTSSDLIGSVSFELTNGEFSIGY